MIKSTENETESSRRMGFRHKNDERRQNDKDYDYAM